jgi:oligoendopeptidase F
MEKTISENWDLDSLYSGGSKSEQLKNVIHDLDHEIKGLSDSINSFEYQNDQSGLVSLEELFESMQRVMSGAFEVDDFLICASADNVKDTSAAKLMAESAKLTAAIESLKSDFDQLLASLPDSLWRELINSPKVAAFQFYLEERKQSVQDKLPLEMEKLIHSLSVNGFKGWDDLHTQLISDMKIPVETDGETEYLSMGQASVKVMFSDDRSVRQKIGRSFHQVCEENADKFATILNRISGFRLDTYEHRGWTNVLKEMLEQNRITEDSLTTMVDTIKEKRNILSKFLTRKAEILKLDKLAWYDLPAPSFQSNKKVSYQDATDIIVKQFHLFSEKLGSFAEKAFQEGWVEAENRSDKVNGAFCASMPVAKESRIFLTFGGNYQDVVTMAHEFGHAYHNYILHDEPYFAQIKGTSVAETASTFTENLVLDAAIDQATTDEEKLGLLEKKIINGLIYLGMIPLMFEFEQKLYEKRKNGLLSASDITELLTGLSKDYYGEAVGEVDKYQWITQSHFYSSEKAFYNIPYTIGYMFSNGVYALAKEHGSNFQEQYDELLRNSGRMTVEQLAKVYLNQDISEKAFWEASIQPIEDAIEEYCEITEKMV